MIVTARWILSDPGTCLPHGGLHVEGGRIVALLPSHSAVKRLAASIGARVHDFGEAVVTPGFVDAHAHLELSALAGELDPHTGFTAWIRSLIARRGCHASTELERAARCGADRLLSTGTTMVGDIDSTGITDSALAGHPLRRRVYREVLDAGDTTRTRGALERFDIPRTRRAHVLEGVAPHAPYTVSQELWTELGRRARRRHLPVTVHWSETREELEWLESARGPFAAILAHSPHTRGLDLVACAGLLGSRTSLVHGNHPAPGELERVARSGAVLVHCPGTHAFFDRAAFDFVNVLDRGIAVALGTDGLASNCDLDMRREMKLVREAAPALSAARVFDMATRSAARAVGLSGRVGELSVGSFADWCVHQLPELDLSRARPGDILDVLTGAGSTVAEVWIAGRRVPVPAD